MPGLQINPHRGWEIMSKSLYDIAQNIKENYGNIEDPDRKWDGVKGEEKFHRMEWSDDYRIDCQDHLRELWAIQDGANCKAIWSGLYYLLSRWTQWLQGSAMV